MKRRKKQGIEKLLQLHAVVVQQSGRSPATLGISSPVTLSKLELAHEEAVCPLSFYPREAPN